MPQSLSTLLATRLAHSSDAEIPVVPEPLAERDLSSSQRRAFDPTADEHFQAIKARQDAYLHKLRGLASLRTGTSRMLGGK